MKQIAFTKQMITKIADQHGFRTEFQNDSTLSRDGFIYRIYNRDGNLIMTNYAIRYSPSFYGNANYSQLLRISYALNHLTNHAYSRDNFKNLYNLTKKEAQFAWENSNAQQIAKQNRKRELLAELANLS